MGNISRETILNKTHYGTTIYSYILRKFYPDETVLTITGRDCGITRNPFNENKETLHIWISKIDPTNVMSSEIACHKDIQNAIPSGDAFAFAELHYKLQGDELLQTINNEMNLHLEDEFKFYAKGKNSNYISKTIIEEESEIEQVKFSFFKAPINNIKPHKAITLLDAYNYIIGEYAKQRTDKLRSILSLPCGEGQGGAARKFKAANFDYCTFSGVFSSRNDKALIKHSGLLCVDFDHLQNLNGLKNRLLSDEYFDTQLLFVSPSGDGLKWIIKISPPLGDLGGFKHADYFAAVANYIFQTYGIEVDKSGRDVSRACFLPHDPQAFINPLILK